MNQRLILGLLAAAALVASAFAVRGGNTALGLVFLIVFVFWQIEMWRQRR
jgi:hypothetical protein